MANISGFRRELCALVQSFLAARLAVIPKPRRPTIPVAGGDESQESQFGPSFELDMDDLAVLDAILADRADDPTIAASSEIATRDQAVAQVMNTTICPSIYRFVCRKIANLLPTSSLSEQQEPDGWIDCWAGCASVVVHNRLRV
jgi:hypothetical protein